MDLKKNWLEVLIVVGILFSLVASFYLTRGLEGLETELVAIAGQRVEVQDFVSKYPASAPHLIRIAPKGIFSIKEGEMLDPHFENYMDDPLVGVIQRHEFGEPFPDVWIIVYSPNPVEGEGYVAQHPPNPAAYVFFGRDRKVLFVEVLE